MKYQSETLRKGEPEDHYLAVEKVLWFLIENKSDKYWKIQGNYEMKYPLGFLNSLPHNRVHFAHKFDLAILAHILHNSESFDTYVSEYGTSSSY